MKHLVVRTLLVISLLLPSLVFSGPPEWAQTNATPETRKTVPTPQKKTKPIPFRGTLKAVDLKARTLTVGQRVFHITSDTKVQKAGGAAKLDAGVVGEPVSGSYIKGDDGILTARSVYFGPRPAAPAKSKKSKVAAQ